MEPVGEYLELSRKRLCMKFIWCHQEKTIMVSLFPRYIFGFCWHIFIIHPPSKSTVKNCYFLKLSWVWILLAKIAIFSINNLISLTVKRTSKLLQMINLGCQRCDKNISLRCHRQVSSSGGIHSLVQTFTLISLFRSTYVGQAGVKEKPKLAVILSVFCLIFGMELLPCLTGWRGDWL